MTFLYILAITLFMVLCLLLCSVILVQEGKGGGLGASFGGDTGDSLFGTGTAGVLRKFTSGLAAAFLIGCLLLSFWTEVIERNKSDVLPYEIEEIES